MRHPIATLPHSSPAPQPEPTATSTAEQSKRLLNYLARTAASTEKALLGSSCAVPDFALVRQYAEVQSYRAERAPLNDPEGIFEPHAGPAKNMPVSDRLSQSRTSPQSHPAVPSQPERAVPATLATTCAAPPPMFGAPGFAPMANSPHHDPVGTAVSTALLSENPGFINRVIASPAPCASPPPFPTSGTAPANVAPLRKTAAVSLLTCLADQIEESSGSPRVARISDAYVDTALMLDDWFNATSPSNPAVASKFDTTEGADDSESHLGDSIILVDEPEASADVNSADAPQERRAEAPFVEDEEDQDGGAALYSDHLFRNLMKVAAEQRQEEENAHEEKKKTCTPVVHLLANSRRLEVFRNGAEMVKDALGRVVEIRSQGIRVSAFYDKEGRFSSFIRTNQNGSVHSVGEWDKHGVIVRDGEGRIRANGESMTLDPVGCLSVRRSDGQFWSVDFLNGMHTERRQFLDSSGMWNVLTAMFAHDGFRMLTRFQVVGDKRFEDAWSHCDGELRFYGRDGSVIHFGSDDDVKRMRPRQVWAPGSKHIDASWRSRRQACTAWQAVQEYAEIVESGGH